MSRKPASFARRIERLWYGSSPVAWLLLPFSWLFWLLVGIRRLLYRSGLLAGTSVGVPVAVVGNITVGGAGKTPLVAWLANRLAADGRRVGILSRGYGGTGGKTPTFVTMNSTASDVGDEPVLLAQLTGARMCVCADRVAGARHLVDAAEVDFIVCDDGLQHYRLARDVEIAVVDGARGLGNGFLLPAGPLRESSRRLVEVDFVFANGGGDGRWRRFDLRPSAARRLPDGEERELDEFRGQRVWSLAGIGNPDRFATMLRRHSIDPEPVDVPDHGVVSLAALRAEQPWPILMTAKDAVKYPANPIGDTWYVPVNLEMSAGDERELMKKICELYD